MDVTTRWAFCIDNQQGGEYQNVPDADKGWWFRGRKMNTDGALDTESERSIGTTTKRCRVGKMCLCWERSPNITRPKKNRTQRQRQKNLNGSLGGYMPVATPHFRSDSHFNRQASQVCAWGSSLPCGSNGAAVFGWLHRRTVSVSVGGEFFFFIFFALWPRSLYSAWLRFSPRCMSGRRGVPILGRVFPMQTPSTRG